MAINWVKEPGITVERYQNSVAVMLWDGLEQMQIVRLGVDAADDVADRLLDIVAEIRGDNA